MMNNEFQFFPTTQNLVNNPQSNNFFSGDSSPEIQFTNDQDSSASDCESGITGSSPTTSINTATSDHRHRRRKGIFSGRVMELSEDERPYEVITRRFLAGVGEHAAKVVAIHRKNWSDSPSQASFQAFQLFSKALEIKHGGGGPPNIKFGWYGGDKDRIHQILSHGFSFLDLQNHNSAVFLSPDHSPAQSIEDSGADEDGLRHVLLCRVLLGRSELVEPGSYQTHPSSDAFDTGVDSYDNPNKYIVWSTKMNTHILPEYVVTFKAIKPSSKGGNWRNEIRMPKSPWISFPALISLLSKYLSTDSISLINTFHKGFKDGRISRQELIQRVRQIAGDKLLVAVIKTCKNHKEIRMSSTFSKFRK